MSNHTDKICPYCQTAIAAANTTYFCSKCQIPHHAKCWQDNDGCTTINHITRNHPRGFFVLHVGIPAGQMLGFAVIAERH